MADNAQNPQHFPFVSVVVPALNCADDVEGFREAMLAQDYPSDRFEVIVVDNGSSDATRERSEAAGFKVLVRPERGRARALNTGVQAARGEYILTTDLSCRAVPHWITEIVATFDAFPNAGCVGGEIYLLKTSDSAVIEFQRRVGYMSPLSAVRRTRLPYMPFADGANASFRRSVFDRIGGFEETFVKAADVEICYRMFVLTDYELVFNRAAAMTEPGEPSLRALLHQRFRMGIGWNLMVMKYPALYRSTRGGGGLRRMWWSVTGQAREFGRLLALNLGGLFGRDRAAAIDASMWELMSWVQWYGKHYGKWWLNRRGIRPIPIDAQRLETFMARSDPLAGRFRLIEGASAE